MAESIPLTVFKQVVKKINLASKFLISMVYLQSLIKSYICEVVGEMSYTTSLIILNFTSKNRYINLIKNKAMKTTFKNPAMLALLIFVLFVNNSFASYQNNDSSFCLKLNGLILKSPNKAERGRYKIELLSNNRIIDSSMVPVNKPFEFFLSKNTWYTVRVTKEGFVPLLISVDTKLNSQNANIYEFQFETELLDAKNINTSNKHVMDFPIGVVRFDSANNRFYPIEEYTADIKKQLFEQSNNLNGQDGPKTLMASQNDED